MRSIRNLDPATVTETPRLPDTHGATWDNAAVELFAAGWRKLDERKPITPPDGYQITGWEYAQDTERADYATETPNIAAIPVPVPDPIDVLRDRLAQTEAKLAAAEVAAKEQAVRQAKELETLQSALTAARDVAAVAESVKAWAVKEKGEKDSAAAAVDPEKPK